MSGTALVLGGGGITGVAWEVGVIAGLAEAGVDLTTADLIVGTSAGSVVGALLATGSRPEQLYAGQLAAPPGGAAVDQMTTGVMLRWAWTIATSGGSERFRRRMGALALAAKTMPESQRKLVIGAQLPVHAWPERRLVITAVDAHTGELVQFDRDSGVSLVDAVGSSCAVPGVWPPTAVNGRRYIDGGIRSPANVDLAAGSDPVVVLAPLPRGGGPVASVARQIAALPAGTKTAVVSPDAAARAVIGRKVLDPARRAVAAEAGRDQGVALAAELGLVWSS